MKLPPVVVGVGVIFPQQDNFLSCQLTEQRMRISVLSRGGHGPLAGGGAWVGSGCSGGMEKSEDAKANGGNLGRDGAVLDVRHEVLEL